MLLKNIKFSGKKIILPIVGEVEIPETGIIEIEDEGLSSSLLEMVDWESAEDKPKGGFKGKVVPLEADEEVDEETSEDEMFEKLNSSSLSELIELAIASDLPREEWDKFAQNTKQPEKLMVTYIKKKLKSK